MESENPREPIDILNGQWSSGDPTLMPPGFCVVCRNLLVRPNRLDSRPPMVYDSLMSITGLFNHDDQTNKKQRLLALSSEPLLYMKGTSGETWSASLGAPSGTRLTDSGRFRGKTYFAMDNGAGVPAAINSFDGTNLSSSPFNSPVSGRCITPYLDRLFIAYPKVTVTNLLDDPYSLTTTISSLAKKYTAGNVTTNTIYAPAATVGSMGSRSTPVASPIAASASVRPIMARVPLRAKNGAYDVPLTIRVGLLATASTIVQRATAYAVGDLAFESVLGTDYVYRCSVAGTTDAAAIGYSAAIGSETVDGTTTWVNEGGTLLNSKSITLINSTESQDWQVFYVPAVIPSTPKYALSVFVDILVGNSTSSAFSEDVVFDFAYRDTTYADGDPRKNNHGWQLTLGDFHFPFTNTDTGATASVDLDDVIWTEFDVKMLRASQTYRLSEVPGFPTAAATVAGRYLVHKRNAIWVFNGNQDIRTLDAVPIRRERVYKGAGAIGPRAWDNLNDVHFFIGEDGVYRFTVGMEEPQELCGDAMRETIMARGANWVEDQATYNMPLLKIDQREKELWVYTQKGKLFCYNLQREAWTTHDIASNKEIADMGFNPTTRKMYFAIGGFGLARMDWSSAPAKDTIDNTATEYDVTCDLVAKPLEMSPDRVDAVVDHFGLYHLATAAQTGQRLIASFSDDRGVTFPYTNEVVLDITDPRNEIPLFQSAPSLTMKLSMIGKTGPSIWALSKLDAEIIVLGGEWPQSGPTPVSASL